MARFTCACAVAVLSIAAVPLVAARQVAPGFQREEPTELITAADLTADVMILRRALEALHPGLYRYNTKEQMATHFAVLETAWGRDSTKAEAFLALAEFTAKIRCGHTFPNPSNQSKAVVAELFQRQDRVPFYFRWIGGRMIVTRDFSEDRQLMPGTEILEINGSPAHTVLERLMTIARADGANDAKRVRLLEVTGSERYETFDLYFPILFPLQTPVFEFRVRPPGGTSDSIIAAAALTYEARLAAYEAKQVAPEDGNLPLWKLSYLPDGTAWLPMTSWVAYKTKWDWTGFVNDTFDSLIERAVPNLVIDLRGNEGGSSVGDVILARLIESSVPRSSSQRFVRYLRTPTELDAVLDTWDPSFKDWSKEAIGPVDLADRHTGLAPGTTGGFYRLRKEDGQDPAESDEMISPRGPRFRGRVFVLVDASNSSATFEFASIVKSLKVGTLVGQPTGGNQRGINGGAFFFVRLPNSGLEVDLPIMAQFAKRAAAVADNAGIEPDVLVAPTVDDLAGGIDAEMNAVQRLIRSAK
jgi:Peptidase family S41